MNTQEIQKPLTQFLHNIPKTIRVDELIIFGSRLEGNAQEDSDVDVLVISDERLDMLYDASTRIYPEIHPWGFTQKELEKASKLKTLGYARISGYRFFAQQTIPSST